MTHQCKHAGMVDIGGYFHVRKLKDGQYSIYEGRWSNNQDGCGVTGLEVISDVANQPLRFATVKDAKEWAFGGNA